jgi:hypothetical protein
VSPTYEVWPNLLYVGELSILSADPGMGKGLISADVAARLSTGREMPDGTRGFYYGKKVRTLILSREDSASRVIKPRLRAAGADESLVAVYNGPLYIGEGIDNLYATIQEIRPAFVVIDPVGSYTDKGTNTNGDAEVRQLLDPLSDLAEETHTAILLVRHMAKIGGKDAQGTKKIYRGLNSIAYTGRVRTELQLSKLDNGNRELVQVKNNYGPDDSAGLAYRPRNRVVFFEDQGFGSRPFAPGKILWGKDIRPPDPGEQHAVSLINAIRENFDANNLAGWNKVRESARFSGSTMEAAVKYLLRAEPTRFRVHDSLPTHKGRVIEGIGPADKYRRDEDMPSYPCRYVDCREVA